MRRHTLTALPGIRQPMSSSCLIIGAGMAGLAAARRLRESGWRVLLVDKGRGVGGRMATRRIGAARFDHGAQYFTTREPQFAALAATLEEAGFIRRWFEVEGEARFAGAQGMSSIAKELASGLEVRTGTRIESIERSGDGWTAQTDAGEHLFAGRLIVTAPVEQALALAAPWLSESSREILREVDYDPCFALMAVLEGPSGLPAPGFLRPAEGPVAWVADNFAKGVSPEAHCVTIHANAEFTRSRYDAPPGEVASELLAWARPKLASPIQEWQLHRWRYSLVKRCAPAPFLLEPGRPPLVLAGDGFLGPRVEAAFLSGLAAADSVRNS